MLKRLYIDNYRSLVNFEIQFDSLNLLLGENGSGKSTVFEVLETIRLLLIDQEDLKSFFNTLTRWQKQYVQTIEFEITSPNGTYQYRVIIEHIEDGKAIKAIQIKEEQLSLNSQKLSRFENGIVELYQNNTMQSLPFQGGRSPVAILQHDEITYFKQLVESWVIVHPTPSGIFDLNTKEEKYPDVFVTNYVGWYRYLALDGGFINRLYPDLAEVLPNFDSFRLQTFGRDDSELVVRFKENSSKVDFDFFELSDGQRMLIILYTLLNLPEREGMENITLFIDEPDNFVALREIQPWITALHDRCLNGDMQAILISHHPETINYLLMPSAVQIGYWFERNNLQSTRVKRIATKAEQEGLSAVELMARGLFPDA